MPIPHVLQRRNRSLFNFPKESFSRVHVALHAPQSRDSRLLTRTVASQRQIAIPSAPFETRPFYSIADLAERWRCSRASVYNRLRGQHVVDFAAAGRKGHKLVPLEIVLKIERAHLRVLR